MESQSFLSAEGPNLACQRGKQHYALFLKSNMTNVTLIRTLHISPRNKKVLNTRTLEADHVGLSLTFSSHMARNPDIQTPQSSHNGPGERTAGDTVNH